eukprot:CAMPEP_0168708996 /NCGR_PEP_ID=MMETSP0503-20121227/41908_2 /TAXON_ID=89963 /ORGANISM="Heterocapsa rotundata, Strain SCCAP K-0483" /LENGTH=243 /DNA_ID=CAMNT_0008755311 /DNA_START=39 /DNA_END=767 /DNA_ORIENTATION=-
MNLECSGQPLGIGAQHVVGVAEDLPRQVRPEAQPLQHVLGVAHVPGPLLAHELEALQEDLPALRDGVHLVEEHQLPRGVEAAVVFSHLDQSIMVLLEPGLPMVSEGCQRSNAMVCAPPSRTVSSTPRRCKASSDAGSTGDVRLPHGEVLHLLEAHAEVAQVSLRELVELERLEVVSAAHPHEPGAPDEVRLPHLAGQGEVLLQVRALLLGHRVHPVHDALHVVPLLPGAHGVEVEVDEAPRDE